jgi:hypothetical protein
MCVVFAFDENEVTCMYAWGRNGYGLLTLLTLVVAALRSSNTIKYLVPTRVGERES